MGIDRHSATAMHLRGVIEEAVEQKRKSIERPGYDWDRPQQLRGELTAYRKMYELVTLHPTQEPTDESD